MISARMPKHMAVATRATQLDRNKLSRRTPDDSHLNIRPQSPRSMAANDRVGDSRRAIAISEGRELYAVGGQRIAIFGDEFKNVVQGILEGVRPTLAMAAGQCRIRTRLRGKQSGIAIQQLVRLAAQSDPEAVGVFLHPRKTHLATMYLEAQIVFVSGAEGTCEEGCRASI